MGFLGSKGVTRLSRKDEVPSCETEQEARTARARGVGQGRGRGLMTALGRASRSELIQTGSRMTTERSQARPAACCACNKTGRRSCFHRRTENAGAASSARQRASVSHFTQYSLPTGGLGPPPPLLTFTWGPLAWRLGPVLWGPGRYPPNRPLWGPSLGRSPGLCPSTGFRPHHVALVGDPRHRAGWLSGWSWDGPAWTA